MSRVLSAFIFAIILAAPAIADGRWQGTGTITAAVGCSGFRVDDYFRVRYRAPATGSSETGADYSTFEPRYTMSFAKATDFSGTFAAVNAISVGNGFGNFANQASIRQISRVPATLAATSPFVTLIIAIRNFDDEAGCNVTINNALVLRLP